MHRKSVINSAEALVKSFASSIRSGDITIGDVKSLIMDCTEDDEVRTKIVLEKIQVRLECMFHMATIVAD